MGTTVIQFIFRLADWLRRLTRLSPVLSKHCRGGAPALPYPRLSRCLRQLNSLFHRSQGQGPAEFWRWVAKIACTAVIPQYDQGMKAAISLPDDLFARADKYAQDKGLSRSALVAEALREYIDRHRSIDITEQLNRAIAAEGQPRDEAIVRQSRQRLKRADW